MRANLNEKKKKKSMKSRDKENKDYNADFLQCEPQSEYYNKGTK